MTSACCSDLAGCYPSAFAHLSSPEPTCIHFVGCFEYRSEKKNTRSPWKGRWGTGPNQPAMGGKRRMGSFVCFKSGNRSSDLCAIDLSLWQISDVICEASQIDVLHATHARAGNSCSSSLMWWSTTQRSFVLYLRTDNSCAQLQKKNDPHLRAPGQQAVLFPPEYASCEGRELGSLLKWREKLLANRTGARSQTFTPIASIRQEMTSKTSSGIPGTLDNVICESKSCRYRAESWPNASSARASGPMPISSNSMPGYELHRNCSMVCFPSINCSHCIPSEVHMWQHSRDEFLFKPVDEQDKHICCEILLFFLPTTKLDSCADTDHNDHPVVNSSPSVLFLCCRPHRP